MPIDQPDSAPSQTPEGSSPAQPTPDAEKLPALPRSASYIAFGLAAFCLVLAFWNPVAMLQFPVFLAAAIGLRRKSFWCGYGFALWLVAGSAGSIYALFTNGRMPTVTDGIAIFVGAMFQLGMAILFFFSGRSLAHRFGRSGVVWPWVAISAAALALPVFFQTFSIPNSSMEDTLLVGDYIVARKVHRPSVARGDIIVFHYPVDRRQVVVKRVVALPGDRVRLDNKRLFINGVPAVEPYAWHKTEYVDSYRDNFPNGEASVSFMDWSDTLRRYVVNGELVVPASSYFVLGDNRDSSLDSRYWGFVKTDDIFAKPVLVYYSVEADTLTIADRPALPPSILHARWNRMFRLLR